MKHLLIVGSVFLSLAGTAHALGANSDKNLKAQVAQQVMQDTKKLTQPEEVNLVNVKRGAFRVTWEADTPNGHYACTSDDMMRNPSCVHVEVAGAAAAEPSLKKP